MSQPQANSSTWQGRNTGLVTLARAHTRTLVYTALMLLTLWLSLREFYSFQFGYAPDSVEYTLLARALLTEPTFALTFARAAPVPTHYPFGYPLLLVPFVLFAPNDLLFPQWLSLFATLVSGTILFWGWKTLAPMYADRWRYAVTAMFMLAPLTIQHTRYILSEPVFTVFVLLSVWFAARLAQSPQRYGFWIGLAVAFLFMVSIRSIGWVVGASVVFYLIAALGRSMIRGGLVALAALTVMVGVIFAASPVRVIDLIPRQYIQWFIVYAPANPLIDKILGGDSFAADPGEPVDTPMSRVEDFRGVDLHIHKDLRRIYFLTGGGQVEPALAARLNAPWLLLAPGYLALSLLVLGNVQWIVDTRGHSRIPLTVFQFSTFAYLVVVFLWRGGGERLFYAVLPQLFLALLLSLVLLYKVAMGIVGRLLPLLRRQPARRAAGAMLGGLVVVWLLFAVYRDLTIQSSYQLWGNLDQRTDAIKAYTPPDAVLLTDWANLDYIRTNRVAYEFPVGPYTATGLRQTLQRMGITHVVLAFDENLEKEGISPLRTRLRSNARVLRELISNGTLVRVYSSPFRVQVLRVAP